MKESIDFNRTMKEALIEEQLIWNIRDLGDVIRFLYEGKGSQKRILIILNETGGMTQANLTKRLGIQPGSASEVIRKLEAAGCIERKQNEKDRRTTDLLLTDAGKKMAEEAVEQRWQRHQDMFSCLTDSEKERLLFLSQKLNADWEKRYRAVGKDGEV